MGETDSLLYYSLEGAQGVLRDARVVPEVQPGPDGAEDEGVAVGPGGHADGGRGLQHATVLQPADLGKEDHSGLFFF